jgi:argininosuccinate lyase
MFVPALFEIKECLDITTFSIQQIEVKDDILNDDKYQYIFSVEAVNDLVMQGISFREAYKKVADDIAEGKFKRPADKEYTHEGSIGNLQTENIKSLMRSVYEQFDYGKIQKVYEKLLKM